MYPIIINKIMSKVDIINDKINAKLCSKLFYENINIEKLEGKNITDEVLDNYLGIKILDLTENNKITNNGILKLEELEELIIGPNTQVELSCEFLKNIKKLYKLKVPQQYFCRVAGIVRENGLPIFVSGYYDLEYFSKSGFNSFLGY